jgi:hypothetical protein
LNAHRAAFGLRVPRGSKDTDIGNRRFCDSGQIHRRLAPHDFGDGARERGLRRRCRRRCRRRRSRGPERAGFRI